MNQNMEKVLNGLLTEALNLFPNQDVVGHIRLTECKYVGMSKQRLVPGVSNPKSDLWQYPELAVREFGECVVGLAAKTEKIQIINDLQCEISTQPTGSQEIKQSYDTFCETVRGKYTKTTNPTSPWEKYHDEILSKIHSEIAVPLLAEDEVLGVINLHSTKVAVFNETHKNQLKEIAERVVIAILKEGTNIIPKFSHLAAKLAGSFDLQDVAGKLAKEIREYYHYDRVDLFSCNKKGNNYILNHIIAKTEEIESDKWQKPPRPDGLGVKAAKSGDFVFCGNVDEKESDGSPVAYDEGMKTTGCLPLKFVNHTVGVLYLHSKERHYFTKYERLALDMFGSLVAVAIKNGISGGSVTYAKLVGDDFINAFNQLTPPENFKAINNEITAFFDDVRDKHGIRVMADSALKTAEKISDELAIPIKIIDKFNELFKHEPILQELERYREHFLHSFHVFLLGYYIISKAGSNKFNTNDDTLLLKRWFTAAIGHDIAYAIEKIPTVVDTFIGRTLINGKINCNFDMSPIIPVVLDNIKRLTKVFNDNQDNKNQFEKWLYESLLVRRDHGVLGALILMKLPSAPGSESISESITDEAALSIALHNYHKNPSPDYKIKYDKHRLPFLLVYCDELQDWGRDTDIINASTNKKNRVKLKKIEVKKNSQDIMEISCTVDYTGENRDLNKLWRDIKTAWDFDENSDKFGIIQENKFDTSPSL